MPRRRVINRLITSTSAASTAAIRKPSATVTIWTRRMLERELVMFRPGSSTSVVICSPGRPGYPAWRASTSSRISWFTAVTVVRDFASLSLVTSTVRIALRLSTFISYDGSPPCAATFCRNSCEESADLHGLRHGGLADAQPRVARRPVAVTSGDRGDGRRHQEHGRGRLVLRWHRATDDKRRGEGAEQHGHGDVPPPNHQLQQVEKVHRSPFSPDRAG